MPITGMIPMVAFPLMDILDTDAVCIMYMKGLFLTLFLGIVNSIDFSLNRYYGHVHRRIDYC